MIPTDSMTRRQFTKTALMAGLIGICPKRANAETSAFLNLNEPLDALQRRINERMKNRLERFGVPGLSLALIREGEPSWAQSYGVKELDRKRPVDNATVFEAASMTKPVSAFVAMTLWKERRLDLDRPLAFYLDKSFQDNAPENYLPITGRNVLSHTSGLPDWRTGKKRPKLAFKPGAGFSYSGEGFMLLQDAMQRITGEPLDVLCQRRIFEPFDMKNSSLVWKEEFEDAFATGYGKKLHTKRKRKMPDPIAAASLISSPSDYAKLVAHILQYSKRQSNGRFESIYRTMLTPQVEVQDGVSWGLGWGLQTCGDEKAFWHFGNNGNRYHSFAIGYPEHGLGLVVMCNSGNGLRLCRELVPDIIGGCHPAFDYEKTMG